MTCSVGADARSVKEVVERGVGDRDSLFAPFSHIPPFLYRTALPPPPNPSSPFFFAAVRRAVPMCACALRGLS